MGAGDAAVVRPIFTPTLRHGENRSKKVLPGRLIAPICKPATVATIYAMTASHGHTSKHFLCFPRIN